MRMKMKKGILKKEEHFNLGDIVRDIQTGFTGKITGVAIYLNEINQYQVQAESIDNNIYPQNAWFSQNRLNRTV